MTRNTAVIAPYTSDEWTIRQPKPRALVSWWTEVKPGEMTAAATRELPRMSISTLGKGRGRVLSTDELNR